MNDYEYDILQGRMTRELARKPYSGKVLNAYEDGITTCKAILREYFTYNVPTEDEQFEAFWKNVAMHVESISRYIRSNQCSRDRISCKVKNDELLATVYGDCPDFRHISVDITFREMITE